MTIAQLNTLIMVARSRYGATRGFLTHRQITEKVQELYADFGDIGEWSESKVRRILAGQYGSYKRNTPCPIPIVEAVKRLLNSDLSPNEFETIQEMLKKNQIPTNTED